LADLSLADSLLGMGVCSVVALHFKSFQWFVSDATKKDLLDLKASFKSADQPLYKSLATRLDNYIAEGKLLILANPFWTTPCPYTNKFFLNQDIWSKELSKSTMIIFKGDLNYRKVRKLIIYI